MSRLLSAGFVRLKKNRGFWIGMGISFFFGVYMAVFAYKINHMYNSCMRLEDIFFQASGVIGILAAAVLSFFLGTEYNDGTIRNKLVIGHKRYKVYLSSLILSMSVLLLLNLSCMAASCLLGIPLLGFFYEANLHLIWTALGISIFTYMAYAAVYTLFGMLIHNRSVSAIICIIGMTVMFCLSGYIRAGLSEPEYYEDYGYTFNGEEMEEIAPEDKTPNPYYLRGRKREVYDFINDFLPTGQSLQTAGLFIEHVYRLPMYSLLIVLTTTGAGICLFRKKDIK